MTPLSKAAQAIELVENQGYSKNKAAQVLGLSGMTVGAIIENNQGWAERKDSPLFSEYLRQEKARLHHIFVQETKEALLEASKKRDKASYSQLVIGAGIMFDKARLLAGEPTSIQASVSIQAITSLDKLAAMLSSSLVESNPVSVDQTTQVVDITPKST